MLQSDTLKNVFMMHVLMHVRIMIIFFVLIKKNFIHSFAYFLKVNRYAFRGGNSVKIVLSPF